jgi:hypothetical protein
MKSRKKYFAARRKKFYKLGLNSQGKPYQIKPIPGSLHPELAAYKWGTLKYKAAYMRLYRKNNK